VLELLSGYGFQSSCIPISACLLFLSACADRPDAQSLTTAIANSQQPCSITITTAQYRQLVASFHPAPGYSYAYSQATALVGDGCALASLNQAGRTIQRVRYPVADVGELSLILLVENDRVIGYQLQVGGEG
jgi:hypothetical protein